MKMISEVFFTQELKDLWIEKYRSTEIVNGDFKKGDCLCALGALSQVLIDEGYAEWDMFSKLTSIPKEATSNLIHKNSSGHITSSDGFVFLGYINGLDQSKRESEGDTQSIFDLIWIMNDEISLGGNTTKEDVIKQIEKLDVVQENFTS